MSEGWTDFLADFMALSDGVNSPVMFRQWTAISLIAGALERRVWAETGGGKIFPNLYVVLVAPPGVGKFVIEMARELWQDTTEPGSKLPAFHVASDSVTNASLMDELAKSRVTKIVSEGPPYEYNSLLIPQEEFEVLLPSYDKQFIASLNTLYNNKGVHKESRRTGSVRELVIKNPQLNLLVGTQPAYLAGTFPEEAWSTGLARRLLMIYSIDTPLRSLWYESVAPEEVRARVIRKLAKMSQFFGRAKWTPEARDSLDKWHLAGGKPAPEHSKLQHYLRSRSVNLVKLALISAVSRTGEFVIDLMDVTRGLAWMTQAERAMPDIFREMIGKSDSQVIEEMHYFVTAIWAKNKQKPVIGEHIMRFLLQRVPHDKAGSIMLAAERANIIARVAGTQDSWIPKPKFEHGVE